jgi:hypothetical protein
LLRGGSSRSSKHTMMTWTKDPLRRVARSCALEVIAI